MSPVSVKVFSHQDQVSSSVMNTARDQSCDGSAGVHRWAWKTPEHMSFWPRFPFLRTTEEDLNIITYMLLHNTQQVTAYKLLSDGKTLTNQL